MTTLKVFSLLIYLFILFLNAQALRADEKNHAAENLKTALWHYCGDLYPKDDEVNISPESTSQIVKIKSQAKIWLDGALRVYHGPRTKIALESYLKKAATKVYSDTGEGSCFEVGLVSVSRTMPAIYVIQLRLNVSCVDDFFTVAYSDQKNILACVFAEPIKPYDDVGTGPRMKADMAFLQSGSDIFLMMAHMNAACFGEWREIFYEVYRIRPGEEGQLLRQGKCSVNTIKCDGNIVEILTAKEHEFRLQVRSPDLLPENLKESYEARVLQFKIINGTLQKGEICKTCKPLPDIQPDVVKWEKQKNHKHF